MVGVELPGVEVGALLVDQADDRLLGLRATQLRRLGARSGTGVRRCDRASEYQRQGDQQSRSP
jgi:hypothetical protein